MPSNDYISQMVAAIGTDVGGTTSRLEMTKAFATAPLTLAVTPAVLRTVMFAGAGTYTLTDPINAGAAGFTTVAASVGVTVSQGTIATQAAGYAQTVTWNNVADTFLAHTLDVTDTSSAAGSLLARWRVGGVDKFVVSKAGAVTAGAASFTTLAASSTATITGNLTVGASTFVVTAATGGFVSTGSGIFKGAVPAHQTSAITLAQDSATESQLRCYGPDAATAGTFAIHLMASDGAPDVNALSFVATGAATFTYGATSKRNGSDTGLAGPYWAVENAAGTRRYSWQLGDTANDHLKLFFWNGATDVITAAFTSSGGLAITGALTGATTGAFSGDMNIGSGKFVVTASTGAVNALGAFSVGNASANTTIQQSGLTATEYYQTAGSAAATFSIVSNVAYLKTTTAHPLILGTNNTANITIASGGALTLSAQPAFVAGSKYLVIDASGNVQVSAVGPAS